MKKAIRIVIFLIPCCMLAANDPVEAYFYHLKSLEFEKAKHAVRLLSDERLKLELYRLSDILFYEGQQSRSSFKAPEVPAGKDKSFIHVVHLLGEGYLDLFYDKLKGASYKNFYEAHQIAKNINHKPLLKATLLALLKYYNFEIVQNSNDQDLYLSAYKALGSDVMDEVWITIYQMIFYSKTQGDLDPDYFVMAERVDAYEHSLSPEHRVWAYIFFENALRHKIEQHDELAQKYYHKAIESAGSYPFLKKIRFFSNINLSVLSTKKNDFISAVTAIDNAKKEFDLADTLRSDFYVKLYASYIYNAQKKYDTAYTLLKRAYELGYKLDFRRNTLEVNRLNVELETQQKENKNLQLQANIEKQQTQKRNILAGALMLLFLGGSIAILFQKNTAKKRKIAEQQQQIETQKVETLLKKQELISIDAMIAGQEKERQQVAHELHDDLGSLMATIKLHFKHIKTVEEDPALDRIHNLLDEAYRKVRSISHTKNSGVFTRIGLLPAVRKMAKNIMTANTLTIEIIDFGLENRMENSLELTIFRIIQELITNVVKHADATKASIQFTQHEANLNLIIEDNGKGFNVSKIKASDNGMGLHSIEKRIEHLEGAFTIESIVNKGTTIIIDIPT